MGEGNTMTGIELERILVLQKQNLSQRAMASVIGRSKTVIDLVHIERNIILADQKNITSVEQTDSVRSQEELKLIFKLV